MVPRSASVSRWVLSAARHRDVVFGSDMGGSLLSISRCARAPGGRGGRRRCRPAWVDRGACSLPSVYRESFRACELHSGIGKNRRGHDDCRRGATRNGDFGGRRRRVVGVGLRGSREWLPRRRDGSRMRATGSRRSTSGSHVGARGTRTGGTAALRRERLPRARMGQPHLRERLPEARMRLPHLHGRLPYAQGRLPYLHERLPYAHGWLPLRHERQRRRHGRRPPRRGRLPRRRVGCQRGAGGCQGGAGGCQGVGAAARAAGTAATTARAAAAAAGTAATPARTAALPAAWQRRYARVGVRRLRMTGGTRGCSMSAAERISAFPPP